MEIIVFFPMIKQLKILIKSVFSLTVIFCAFHMKSRPLAGQHKIYAAGRENPGFILLLEWKIAHNYETGGSSSDLDFFFLQLAEIF